MNSLWNDIAGRANVVLGVGQHALLNRYLDLLAEGNQQMNLTRIEDRAMAEVTHIIAAKRRLRVIYISVVDRQTMDQLREVVPGQCLLAISYWVDEVRLTDNMPL